MPSKEPYDPSTTEDLTSSGAWKMRIGLLEERSRILEEALANRMNQFGERLGLVADKLEKLEATHRATDLQLSNLAGKIAAWGVALTAAAPLLAALVRKVLG